MSAKKQEFLNGQIVLYNGDCLDVMRDLKDKEIDLVLTDPPFGGMDYKRFGQGRFAKYNKDGKADCWDIAPEKKIFEEIFRISKEQIIWGGNYFELPATRCFLIWKKLTISEKFSMAMAEYAWTSFNKNAKLFEYAPQDTARFHPTQKPVALMAWCLNNYSQENDLIFDGFLGSGTTAIACIRTKRRLIGCELDNEYFDKMCKRIEEELRQGNLF
jgi:site-specific DNA-methyltransferase (adenine-specific)